jgi:hypothetical protein
MHGALVLDFDATEDGRAADIESLASGGWISLNILCLVIVSAEDSDALHNDIPIDRDANFSAAENSIGFDESLVAGHFSTGEIKLISAKNGAEIRALKSFAVT